MRLRVGCEIRYQSAEPVPMLFLLRPRVSDRHRLLAEERLVVPAVPIHAYEDPFGNHVWRITAPTGALCLRYDAVVEVSSAPDPVLPELPGTPVAALPDDLLPLTLPSRYCQSDLLADDAWRLFGDTPDGWARVQAVCDWVHAQIAYEPSSTSATSAEEAYRQRRGVCRDFAHIGITLCRALNIPARYVCGYLPEIDVPLDPSPMDFHAWFEAYLAGAWRTFDARHNIPRVGRVVIARGRDAVDAAWSTSYGPSQFQGLEVWAAKADSQTAR